MLRLRIEEVTVDTSAERAGAEAVPGAIRAAFSLLAERLRRSPFGRDAIAPLVIERVEIERLSLDELCAPGGAERLADELYQGLARRVP